MEGLWLNSIVLLLVLFQFECVYTFTFSLQTSKQRTLTATGSHIRVYSKSEKKEKDDVPVVDFNSAKSDGGSPLSSAQCIVPQNVTLDVLYEDLDMLVINKPSGMIMQFVPGSVESSVVFYLQNNDNYTSSSWPWKSPESFEGIVHRIDRETSGILVVGKNPIAAKALHRTFKERRVQKTYLAIAVGFPTEEKLASLQETTTNTLENSSFSPLELHAQPQLLQSPEQQYLSKQIKKCGRDVDKALELLHQSSSVLLVTPSAINFNAAMGVCKRAGQRDKALAIFDSMKDRYSVIPNTKCFLKAINLCAKKPPLYEKAIELVEYMEVCDLPLNPNCISSAISACGHAGQIKHALGLLRRIEESDDERISNESKLGCFKAAIGACERCGASSSSLALEKKLKLMIMSDTEKNIANAMDSQARLNEEIIIDAPIGRLGSRRRLMGIQSIDQGGRKARTIVSALAFDGILSLNRITIETGRTHQIRVHMASMLGCPLAGDSMYNNKNNNNEAVIKETVGRCMLHAAEISVPHPTTGIILNIVCPPPPDFSALAETITSNTSSLPLK